MSDEKSRDQNDFLDYISEALRECARRGTLPSQPFLKKCEEVGFRALKHRRVIDRLQDVARDVAYRPLPLAEYVRDLIEATRLSEREVETALGLDDAGGLQSLNDVVDSTRSAVLLIGIDRQYVRQALRLAVAESVSPYLLAPRQWLNGGMGLETVLEEMEKRIRLASEQDAQVSAALEKCDERLAAWS